MTSISTATGKSKLPNLGALSAGFGLLQKPTKSSAGGIQMEEGMPSAEDLLIEDGFDKRRRESNKKQKKRQRLASLRNFLSDQDDSDTSLFG